MAVADPAPPTVTVLPWPAFGELFRRKHKQGEHVALVGPTGSGKSVLGLELCKLIGSRFARDRRPARVTVFAYKPRDRTISGLGWPVVKEWPPPYGKEHCVVWPAYGDPATAAARQSRVFGGIMRRAFAEGGQTIYVDEMAYFERPLPHGLGLSPTVEQYWSAARSLDLTLVAGTQRPRRVSRAMWSEPTWIFVFRLEDEEDLKRVAELAGDKRELAAAVHRLGGHEFLVIHRPRAGVRSLYVSRVDAPAPSSSSRRGR